MKNDRKRLAEKITDGMKELHSQYELSGEELNMLKEMAEDKSLGLEQALLSAFFAGFSEGRSAMAREQLMAYNGDKAYLLEDAEEILDICRRGALDINTLSARERQLTLAFHRLMMYQSPVHLQLIYNFMHGLQN